MVVEYYQYRKRCPTTNIKVHELHLIHLNMSRIPKYKQYLAVTPTATDMFNISVDRVAGFPNEDPAPDLRDVDDFLIVRRCTSERGGASNIMRWSIPHFFPEHRFKDMAQDNNTQTEWTAKSDYDGSTWAFHFYIDKNDACREFDISLLSANRLVRPGHSYVQGVARAMRRY